VNSLAQKLLRSARRKRGALQGVNVLNCSHVVPVSSATPHLLFLAAIAVQLARISLHHTYLNAP
jgi:hypothetical protein